MRVSYKVILLGYLLVPLAAYLDAVIIREYDLYTYLYICLFEMTLYSIGVLTGFKAFQKEHNREELFSKVKRLFRR